MKQTLAQSKVFQIVFFVISTLVISCKDDEKPSFTEINSNYCTKTDLECDTYLPPFHVGDYWLAYDKSGNSTIKIEVVSTDVFDGKNYFKLTWYRNEVEEFSFYDRYEGTKHFGRSDGSTPEKLYVDTSVDLGTEWDSNFGDGTVGSNKLETKTGTLTVNNVALNDALIFKGTSNADPTKKYYTATYLPGLGFVDQQDYANGIKTDYCYTTYECRIDGKVYKIKS